MANTGNGEKENTMGQAATVESSGPFPMNEKQSTPKTKKPITPEEAAELLLSALDYCKLAGLRVQAYNESDGYAVLVVGLKSDGGRIVPMVTPSVTPKVTPIPPAADPVTP